ncbi:MAG: response regulator [Chloroflexota bacterium]
MTHLLVIDDETVFHDLIGKAFGEYHFQVSKATNGMTGLAMARNLHPDVIICDVMMPDVMGI